MLTTCLDVWVALEEWKLRLTAAKVEVEVEAHYLSGRVGGRVAGWPGGWPGGWVDQVELRLTSALV